MKKHGGTEKKDEGGGMMDEIDQILQYSFLNFHPSYFLTTLRV